MTSSPTAPSPSGGKGRRGIVAVALCAAVVGGIAVAVLAHASRPPAAGPATRTVSYGGVQVTTPAEWPLVDGMHARPCGGPFPDAPTALVGPNENPPPSCPLSNAAPVPHDGVWLQPGTAPVEARVVETAGGERVLQVPSVP